MLNSANKNDELIKFFRLDITKALFKLNLKIIKIFNIILTLII